MAFQRPTTYAPQPHLSISEEHHSVHQRIEDEQSVETSQEWVLFSPSARPAAEARTDVTEDIPHTTDASPLSDLGLPCAGEGRHSEDEGDTDYIGSTHHEARDEEDGLDSLDSHLYAFHEPSMQRFSYYEHNNATVLPAHDGTGSFAKRAEELLPSLEPRYSNRQNSSVWSALEAAGEEEMEAGRTERIRAWRLEQSQMLLERIEDEVKRMQTNETAEHSGGALRSGDDAKLGHSGSISGKSAARPSLEKDRSNEGRATGLAKDMEDDANAPFWKRITRRVIRDIIGIDEPLLSIILGESLPEIDETSASNADLSSNPLDTVGQDVIMASRRGWQERLLERIALELGKLIHRLSRHPGAFSTYLRTQQTPGYVGATFPTTQTPPQATPRSSSLEMEANYHKSNDLTNAATQFLPSLSPKHILSGPKSNPITPPLDHSSTSAHVTENERLRLEREYWERELDVSMVFSFLRNRFGGLRRRPSPPTTHITSQPSSILPSSPAIAATTRAATIRQHHPLASKLQHSQRMDNSTYQHHLPSVPISLKRPGSTCGSESTKSNKKAKGRGSDSGVGSRNYWDLGGSVGGSTDIATEGGGLGGWGEV